MSRFIILCIYLFFLMSTFNVAFAQQASEWQDISIEGVDNYNRANFQKAAEKFELALVLALTSEEGGPRLVNSYLNLALAYEALKRDGESEKLYLEAIRLQEKDYGVKDPALAVMLSRLAGLYTERGEWVMAEPLLRRALSVREDVAGVNHPYTALAVEELGNLLFSQERYREAIVQFERAIMIRANNFGSFHRSLGSVLTSLGISYLSLGRLPEAESALLNSLRIWDSEVASSYNEIIRTLKQIVVLYSLSNRYSDALRYEERVIENVMNQFESEGMLLVEEIELYAAMLLQSGNIEAANIQLQKANNIRDNIRE